MKAWRYAGAMRKLSSRLPFLLTLVAVAILLHGCIGPGKIPANLRKALEDRFSIRFIEQPLKKSGPKDHYLAIHDTEDRGAFLRPPLDLHPPFRWELKFGLFSPSTSTGDGIFGTELDVRGSEPLVFYGLFAQSVNGGLNVFASSNAGIHGSKFYAGIRIVEAAVEHDGKEMIFFARPAGSDAPYDEIARLSVPDLGGPLNATAGAFNIGAGEVGFDCIRVVKNGNPPEPVSPEHDAANALFAVAREILEAIYSLDGFTPDAAEGGAHIQNALDLLDAAMAQVEALDEPGKKTPQKLALKNLKKAGKKIAKALKLLEKSGLKKSEKVVKNLWKGGVQLVIGGAVILPADLRASLPGEVKNF